MRAMLIALLSGSVFVGTALFAYAQEKDVPTNAKEPSAEELITKEDGSVDIGSRHLRIWASTRNPNSPAERWQFRFDPLFLPELDSNKRIKFSRPTAVGNAWEVSFNLLLNSPEANSLALESVKTNHPNEAAQINKNNVFARQILWLRMTPKGGFRDAFPSARLARPFWNMARPASLVRVTFITDTKEEAESIIANPDRLDLDFDYALVAASTSITSAHVTSKLLNNSELIARLDGLGVPEVYIRRFDARRLLDDLRQIVVGEALIENPEAFNDSIMKELLTTHFEYTRATQDAFDAEKWKATYHGDDLKPDVLTRTLRKLYTFDEKTQKWSATGSLDTSGKFSYAALGAEGALKGSYSTDEFKKFLEQRNIEVDLTGNIIVVKSIDVYRVNVSKLKKDFDTVVKWTEVRPPQISRYDESVNVGLIGREMSVALAQATAALNKKEMEVSQKSAQASKTSYEGTQWINDEGKKIATDAANGFSAALASAQSANEEMDRNKYDEASRSFTEARSKFKDAESKYSRATTLIEPERFVSIYVYVKTSNDNKECGGWRVRITQGGTPIFDDSWGWGQNWDNGSENPATAERTKPMNVLVDGKDLLASSSIEERPGEVRIDWGVKVMIVSLKTNRGREFRFVRSDFKHKSRGDGGALKTLDIPRG